ncbi:hypothetical protein VTO73DRAFT_9984 [Trametes versicolor]
MPVQLFIDNFLPDVPPDRKEEILSSRGAFSTVPSSGSTPSAIYEPLLSALNKSTINQSRAPGLVFENTSIRSEHPHEPGFMKPHISCFTSENLERVRLLPPSSRAELGYAELFIEVRPDIAFEFFIDPPSSSKPKEWKKHDIIVDVKDDQMKDRIERAFGQHIAYATEIQARQQRLCLFSVSFCGSRARLFRWDRSGIIVSRSFDVREQPELLCEFLARYACASHTDRGHDQTVEMATQAEEAIFQDVVSRHVEDQLGLTGDDLAEAVSEHYQEGHVMAVHVFVKTGTDIVVDRYLVSRPVTSPMMLGGRATRGYWAAQASTRRLVFLKDTWRLPGELEGDIIAGLHTAGVRNIPLLVAHGDVYHRLPTPGELRSRELIHYSWTDVYDTTSWASLVARRRISVNTNVHYRLVLGTVGYALKSFKGTDELLHATYDAFQAMRDALQKDSRLHRDISVGNILLVKERGSEMRRGYLIDWEASSRVDSDGRSLCAYRMGTWRFMSGKMLTEPEKGHFFQDDMESLLHVVFHCSLLHLRHNLRPDQLRPLMHEFFDRTFFMGRQLYGGAAKRVNSATRLFSSRVKWSDPDIQTWLDAVMDLQGPTSNPRELAHLWADPGHLETFWRTFLAQRTLARDDRVENKLSPPDPPLNYASGSDVSFVGS